MFCGGPTNESRTCSDPARRHRTTESPAQRVTLHRSVQARDGPGAEPGAPTGSRTTDQDAVVRRQCQPHQLRLGFPLAAADARPDRRAGPISRRRPAPHRWGRRRRSTLGGVLVSLPIRGLRVGRVLDRVQVGLDGHLLGQRRLGGLFAGAGGLLGASRRSGGLDLAFDRALSGIGVTGRPLLGTDHGAVGRRATRARPTAGWAPTRPRRTRRLPPARSARPSGRCRRPPRPSGSRS